MKYVITVSLLATDYKILTKALSIKLQKVIPSLINSDQVGYIKGRNICENIRIIKDLISFTAMNKSPGFLTLIDFENPFDTVEWPFLFKTLKSFNFGDNFLPGLSCYIQTSFPVCQIMAICQTIFL